MFGRALTALCLCLVASPGPSFAQLAAPAPEAGRAWLMVVHGPVIAAEPGRLTLSAGTHAVAFTDRPDRDVALVNLVELSEAWAAGGMFQVDPPNAAVVDEERDELAIVEITMAEWADGRFDMLVTVLSGTLPEAGDVVAIVIDAIYKKPVINPY